MEYSGEKFRLASLYYGISFSLKLVLFIYMNDKLSLCEILKSVKRVAKASMFELYLKFDYFNLIEKCLNSFNCI